MGLESHIFVSTMARGIFEANSFWQGGLGTGVSFYEVLSRSASRKGTRRYHVYK